MLDRDTLIIRLAHAYHNLLLTLSPDLISNNDILLGIKEGLNKFLSNLAIKLNGKYDLNSADYISCEALAQIKRGDKSDLVYEHMIPKELYVQGPCLNAALTGNCLSYQQIYDLLNKYWFIAIITKAEDIQLNLAGLRRKMPDNWDKQNIFARYNAVKIHLHKTKKETQC